VEEKIDVLQKQITSLIGALTGTPNQTSIAVPLTSQSNQVALTVAEVLHAGPSMTLHCSQWNDFQTLAQKAQNLSFTYREQEKVFQADALKGNQIITYSGSLPIISTVLKMWLSKQLDIPEHSILEGILTVG
jgi:hypothetical protein